MSDFTELAAAVEEVRERRKTSHFNFPGLIDLYDAVADVIVRDVPLLIERVKRAEADWATETSEWRAITAELEAERDRLAKALQEIERGTQFAFAGPCPLCKPIGEIVRDALAGEEQT